MWPHLNLGNTAAVKSTISNIFNDHGKFDDAYVLNGGAEVKTYICVEAEYCALHYAITICIVLNFSFV